MSLGHTLDRNGPALTVALSGDVTFAESAAFRDMITAVIAAKPTAVAVDLSGVRIVDSAGLSQFVLLREQLSKAGASITLQRPPAHVERVLDVVGFSKLFTIIR
ncbi:STAS domain-containing protein [Azospirillum sp. sgz301742]